MPFTYLLLKSVRQLKSVREALCSDVEVAVLHELLLLLAEQELLLRLLAGLLTGTLGGRGARGGLGRGGNVGAGVWQCGEARWVRVFIIAGEQAAAKPLMFVFRSFFEASRISKPERQAEGGEERKRKEVEDRMTGAPICKNQRRSTPL